MPVTTFQIAKQRFEQYSADFDEQLMEDHAAAMDCLDCETHIQMGIDAIRWLELAEQAVIRVSSENPDFQAIHEGKSLNEWLKSCYRSFLEKAEHARAWIFECESRGFEVSNRSRFESTIESAEDWLEQDDWQCRSASVYAED